MKIVVAGALANKPGNGGGAWERLSWVTGFRRLGHDVRFVEQVNDDAGLQWFLDTTEWFGLSDISSFVDASSDLDADLLVNLSGHLTSFKGCRRSAFVDVDPGFTHVWHADPTIPYTIPRHDYYFTIGENIGTPACRIPTGGLTWHATRQPVVLDDWPVTRAVPGRFTTIASWRGPYGPLPFEGKLLGLKVHEFRKFIELPKHLDWKCELALDIHPDDEADRLKLIDNGWKLTSPRELAGTADAFQKYVQTSSAELSVAQGVYVETNSAWFSDRSVRYLPSGRPVLVQDTGFVMPKGDGLHAFTTMEDAIAGAKNIIQNYEHHCRAARQLAADWFDSDRVLTRFLEVVA